MLAISVASLAASVVFAGFPIAVDAFWPFTKTKAADEEPPVLHDPEVDYLDPATHPDPNPSKGGLAIATTEGSALIPSGGPVDALPPSVTGRSSAGSILLYEIREGDNLSVIADAFGVTVNTILWANEIEDPATIQPGDVLLILPVTGLQHKVAKGETLETIAKKYEADAGEIALFNGLDAGSDLAVGSEIIIPGGDLPTEAVAHSSSAPSGSGSAAASVPAVSSGGYFANPVPGAPITQGLHGYNGIDFGASCGVPVYAAADGPVLVAKSGGGYNGGYGNYIAIAHTLETNNDAQTLYAHLSSVNVSVGEVVSKGDRIGSIGNTGRTYGASGCHLHFEVRGGFRNPFAR
ncbi:peptidoglycan DD-metalloendopeptidase family protein [Candidatus Parcubacteria bacterium]|nr:peptidoglycan DD-metalloendopeptidase family protein [Candidatus Parcubacteria bacterium]